jgi:hypothetical protein
MLRPAASVVVRPFAKRGFDMSDLRPIAMLVLVLLLPIWRFHPCLQFRF